MVNIKRDIRLKLPVITSFTSKICSAHLKNKNRQKRKRFLLLKENNSGTVL
jgi:hypothetical protein